VEGAFSIFKRGMKGVYQHCGKQHLHRYLAEFEFRYNTRTANGFTDWPSARPRCGLLTFRCPTPKIRGMSSELACTVPGASVLRPWDGGSRIARYRVKGLRQMALNVMGR
jgi:hypothetical protein